MYNPCDGQRIIPSKNKVEQKCIEKYNTYVQKTKLIEALSLLLHFLTYFLMRPIRKYAGDVVKVLEH